MERSNFITLSVIVSIIAGLGFYAYLVTQKNTQVTLDTSAAGTALGSEQGEFAYTDIEGNPIAISENLGKILVVNSWASWCPACANELPDLAKLGDEYAEKNVVVLAINRAEPKTTAAAYLTSINAVDGLQLVLDPNDKFYTSIDGFAMPETLFYDPKGNVIFHQRGAMTYQEIKAQVDSLIQQTSR